MTYSSLLIILIIMDSFVSILLIFLRGIEYRKHTDWLDYGWTVEIDIWRFLHKQNLTRSEAWTFQTLKTWNILPRPGPPKYEVIIKSHLFIGCKVSSWLLRLVLGDTTYDTSGALLCLIHMSCDMIEVTDNL